MWRQGDILIQSCDRVPRGAALRQDLVIHEGVVTGHRHEVSKSRGAELYALDDELYLRVIARTATVSHPEHAPIELPSGIYRVWRQREFTGTSRSRFVAD